MIGWRPCLSCDGVGCDECNHLGAHPPRPFWHTLAIPAINLLTGLMILTEALIRRRRDK